MAVPRQNQIRTSPECFLTSGHDLNGTALSDSEIIGPIVRLVDQSMAPSSSGQGPGISATIPQGGETGLPTDQVVSVFFTEPMNVTTLSTTTVSLRTFTGSVSINVVPAEGGMLLFVTPQSPLENDTNYTLTTSGVKDNSGNVLPWALREPQFRMCRGVVAQLAAASTDPVARRRVR